VVFDTASRYLFVAFVIGIYFTASKPKANKLAILSMGAIMASIFISYIRGVYLGAVVAGIFAIIQIIKSGLRPSIILTTDEESGAIGASALAKNPCPIAGLKYMIQLDRRGTNDCVFYSCGNLDFIDYVETFGFIEKWGSFSDISVLMPAWKICGVNLSVGYEDEHSVSEVLFIKPLFDTINKVKNMLKEKEIPSFTFKEYVSDWSKIGWGKVKTSPIGSYPGEADDLIYGAHCSNCGKLFSEYEMFPVHAADKPNTVRMFCTDCVVDKVNWCATCGEAFETNSSSSAYECARCVAKRGDSNVSRVKATV
jgi:DNA-directed RNA polymerase subunit RPC12/RpoP